MDSSGHSVGAGVPIGPPRSTHAAPKMNWLFEPQAPAVVQQPFAPTSESSSVYAAHVVLPQTCGAGGAGGTATVEPPSVEHPHAVHNPSGVTQVRLPVEPPPQVHESVAPTTHPPTVLVTPPIAPASIDDFAQPASINTRTHLMRSPATRPGAAHGSSRR